MNKLRLMIVVLSLCIISTTAQATAPALGELIKKDTRCPVCGMFVAKYPHWITILLMSDGTFEAFDGVKDMMVFYLFPENYNQENRENDIQVRVKDYYTQEWIDGRTAYYVKGSDVLGPMGHELIPFGTKPAAENFMKDHKGGQVLSFDLITKEMINMLRRGYKMKNHTMSGHGKQHSN